MDRLSSKQDQFEEECRSNSNAFESETVLEFFIKIEENDEYVQENGPCTNQSSRGNNPSDENMLERGTDAQCCNIKKEEIEDDFCGIIEGFLDNSDDDMCLQNEGEDRRLMQETHVEDFHSQVSRFWQLLMNLNF